MVYHIKVHGLFNLYILSSIFIQSVNQVVFVETAGFPFQKQVALFKVDNPSIQQELYTFLQIYLAMNDTSMYPEWTIALNAYLLSSPVVSILLLFLPSSVSEHSPEHLLIQDLCKFSPRI